MNICKNLSAMALSRMQLSGYARGSTERLYEDEIYKYLAISSLLRFGTQ